MSGAATISARRAGTLFSARVITPVVTLGIYSALAHLGAPGELGLYYYTYNFVTIFQVLANFGYDSFLMREVAHAPDRARALLANSLVLLAPYGMLLGVAMPIGVAALGYPETIVTPLWIGALAVPPMVLAYALEAVLIGQERFRAILAGSLIDNALRVVLSVLAVVDGRGVGGLLGALAISRTAAVVWYLICSARSPGLLPLRPDTRILRELLAGATPFLIMYANYAIATRLDGALLARFSTPQQGDAYSIPNRLTMAVWLFSGSVVASIFPAMARAAGGVALGALVLRVFRLFLILAIPAAALLSCYADLVLIPLAGRATATSAAPVLRLLAWAIVPLLLNEPALRGLLAARGHWASVRISFVLLATSFLVMTSGVLWGQARGAALALPVVISVDCTLNTLALSRRADLRALPRILGRIVAAGLMSVPILYLLASRIGVLAAPAFLALYLFLLLALGSVAVDDLRDPRRLLRA